MIETMEEKRTDAVMKCSTSDYETAVKDVISAQMFTETNFWKFKLYPHLRQAIGWASASLEDIDCKASECKKFQAIIAANRAVIESVVSSIYLLNDFNKQGDKGLFAGLRNEITEADFDSEKGIITISTRSAKGKK